MSDQLQRAVVVNTSQSVCARLRPMPVAAVRLSDGFWAPRLRINREVTVLSQHQHLEETGRLDNFCRAAGKLEQPFFGIYFRDSDVYKWLEAASWVLASDPEAVVEDRLLSAVVDDVIAELADAQGPDGYLACRLRLVGGSSTIFLYRPCYLYRNQNSQMAQI